jgi:hypothetical protein
MGVQHPLLNHSGRQFAYLDGRQTDAEHLPKRCRRGQAPVRVREEGRSRSSIATRGRRGAQRGAQCAGRRSDCEARKAQESGRDGALCSSKNAHRARVGMPFASLTSAVCFAHLDRLLRSPRPFALLACEPRSSPQDVTRQSSAEHASDCAPSTAAEYSAHRPRRRVQKAQRDRIGGARGHRNASRLQRRMRSDRRHERAHPSAPPPIDSAHV